jgi:hypothetical protein
MRLIAFVTDSRSITRILAFQLGSFLPVKAT